MTRVIPGRQHHRGLHQKVGGQGRECEADQPQAAALAVRLSSTPGVVAHGLFPPQMVAIVFIGRGESAERINFTSAG